MDFGLSFENPERKFGFNGEEKIGGIKGESFDVDEGPLEFRRNALWVPSRIQKGATPLLHGANSRENLMFDEEYEYQHDILGLNESKYNSNSSQLNADDEKKPKLDRSSALPTRPMGSSNERQGQGLGESMAK